MDRNTLYIYVFTRLFINPGGEVACRNLAVTLDVFEAENHLAGAVENDFERYALPADWRE